MLNLTGRMLKHGQLSEYWFAAFLKQENDQFLNTIQYSKSVSLCWGTELSSIRHLMKEMSFWSLRSLRWRQLNRVWLWLWFVYWICSYAVLANHAKVSVFAHEYIFFVTWRYVIGRRCRHCGLNSWGFNFFLPLQFIFTLLMFGSQPK